MGRTRIAAVLLAASLVVVACGDDDDGASPATVPAGDTSSTPTLARESTSTTEDPTAAVEQAFYDQWDAFVEITSDPDIDNPLIDEFFTGEAKEAVLDGVSKLIADGYAIRLPDDSDSFRPSVNHVEVISATEAIVYECTLDGLVVYDRSTDEVLNDSVDRLAQRNEFLLVDGRWKAAGLRDVMESEPQCDDF